MKKLFKILFSCILLISLCACKTNSGSVVKTCSGHNNYGYDETVIMTAENDFIKKINLTFTYDNSIFEIETFSDLTDEEKLNIENNMLKELGLESKTYDGFEVKFDIQDRLTVSIDAELDIADPEILEKTGLKFEDSARSLKNSVKGYKKSGYTCK